MSEVTGQFSEPVEWRHDMGCGASKLNSLGTAATCSHPYVGDAERDTARCCKDNRCQEDLECSCATCERHTSIEESARVFNQYSVHVGIPSFLPLAYGLIEDTEEIQRAIQELTDEATMLSQHGLRSLSAKD